MKKLLGIVVLGLIVFTTSADALTKSKKTKFKTGQLYEDTVFWEGGVTMKLPPGQWEMIAKWGWSVSSVRANGVTLVLREGNKIKAAVGFSHIDSGGKWIGYINDWLRSVFLVNPTDGCYERSEYYLDKRSVLGAAFNCLIIRHDDVMKELYGADKDAYKTSGYNQGPVKVWIRKNNIEVPKIMLSSEHIFYAPSVRNKVLGMGIAINPELYGAPAIKFGTEETSEFHRANIDQYPEIKKFMENWVKISAKRHKIFEKNVKAKNIHKLDLSKYGVAEAIEETKTTVSSSSTTEELKECVKLFKANELTKEQFENCKNKVLSQ